MLSGFFGLEDGTIRSVDSISSLPKDWSRSGGFLWLDLQTSAEDELQEVGKSIGLDSGALDDCLQGEQRPRIDEFEGYLFLVFYGMLGVDQEEAFSPRKLAAFIGSYFLVTVHRQPLRTITAVLDRCVRNTAKLMSWGADGVLFHILDGMVDKYLFAAEQYEAQIEELEETSLEADADGSILREAGDLRRKLLELRRLAVSQRELITPLAKGEFDYISESLELRFRHVADHLAHVIEATDVMRERLQSVRDNFHTSLADRTNATMKTLTLVATVMLPMSLIAGIYGMNVPVWPSGEDPLSFWIVIAVMAAIGGALFAFLWRRE